MTTLSKIRIRQTGAWRSTSWQSFRWPRVRPSWPERSTFGRFVVVIVDLLVVLGFPVNEHAADDHQVLGLILGMIPCSTESATALATAACAGPNICTACVAPLMVTLVISTVAGLTARFGVRTASKLLWPADCRARALANATPTGPALSPINRSMWAISLPSPTSGFLRRTWT